MSINSINSTIPHSPAWKLFSWAGFVLSLTLVAIGVYHLPADPWIKGYIGMGIFCITLSSFILAKTVRDEYEAGKFINRLSSAKTEKLLSDYESPA